MDGFTAAWAAWKKFGDQADYIPLLHGAAVENWPKDKEIYFVDFVPKEEDLQKLIASNKSVTAIDHHKSSEATVKIAENRVFDISKSGAVLAWEFFHPEESVPLISRYVQDMDIWTWKLPDAEAVINYIELMPFGFSTWDKLRDEMESSDTREKIFEKGRLLTRAQDIMMDRVIENSAQTVLFEGYEILAVNNSAVEIKSKIGNRLCKMKPPIGIVWYERKDAIAISLRSDGSVDVSELAQKYGGGGHRAAGAFTLPLGSKLPWKILNK